MPVDYSTTVLNNRLQQVINAIDAGASNGFMRLLDISGSIVSSFQLSRPCAVATGGTMTFNGLSLIDPSAVGGDVAFARVEDSTGNVVIHGLTLNADFFVSPTPIIAPGQTVALTAATITGN